MLLHNLWLRSQRTMHSSSYWVHENYYNNWSTMPHLIFFTKSNKIENLIASPSLCVRLEWYIQKVFPSVVSLKMNYFSLNSDSRIILYLVLVLEFKSLDCFLDFVFPQICFLYIFYQVNVKHKHDVYFVGRWIHDKMFRDWLKWIF